MLCWQEQDDHQEHLKTVAIMSEAEGVLDPDRLQNVSYVDVIEWFDGRKMRIDKVRFKYILSNAEYAFEAFLDHCFPDFHVKTVAPSSISSEVTHAITPNTALIKSQDSFPKERGGDIWQTLTAFIL